MLDNKHNKGGAPDLEPQYAAFTFNAPAMRVNGMTTVAQSPNTINFDTALAQVCARARTLYPQETARIERGHTLAITGAVHFRADGTADVQSQADPMTRYHVNGLCDCKDHFKAPGG